jgi:phosphoglycolate/pyridoxal phosphate phosphatase family enzyme
LDGVIYRGEQPLPGAVDTIRNLRHLGHQVYFFTNNSTQTRTTFARKLSGMGIPVDEDHIMTSAYATALYLKERGARGKSVYVLGEKGPRVELTAIGMTVVEDALAEKTDYVVVGLDRYFDYGKLTQAQQAIVHGAELIATNTDTTFPLEDGLVVPGGGSIVAAVEAASGVKAIVIGKPETPAMNEILSIAQAVPEQTVVVGDRLETDILAGKRIGATTVLVLTGVTKREDLNTAPPDLQPDIVVDTLPEMITILGL